MPDTWDNHPKATETLAKELYALNGNPGGPWDTTTKARQDAYPEYANEVLHAFDKMEE